MLLKNGAFGRNEEVSLVRFEPATHGPGNGWSYLYIVSSLNNA